MKVKDIFICHATKDKKRYVEPFIKALKKTDITYWIDKEGIGWGDSVYNKICEGLLKSRYVIVFLTRSFLSAKWAPEELANAYHMERNKGKTFILPLLITHQRHIFSKHPLLSDKKYIKWSDGIEFIIANIISMIEEEKKIYLRYINDIDKFQINDHLNITEIRYGEGANIESIKEDRLVVLDKTIRLAKVEKKGIFTIKNLFSEEELHNFKMNEKMHFPRNITVCGKKTLPDRTVAIFSIKDIVYPPEIDSTEQEKFEIEITNGRGGIAEFFGVFSQSSG